MCGGESMMESMENYIGNVGGEGQSEVPLSRVVIFDQNRANEFGSGYYRIVSKNHDNCRKYGK